ncbi:hypothetical protein [Cumulibacter soli]|uniref:hypothetical protein n=1 Tax=Cumulibacter soli TaxID=2546344 RepID=UPI0010677894|nr:hypothetical protein [Cumulibacter soli]
MSVMIGILGGVLGSLITLAAGHVYRRIDDRKDGPDFVVVMTDDDEGSHPTAGRLHLVNVGLGRAARLHLRPVRFARLRGVQAVPKGAMVDSWKTLSLAPRECVELFVFVGATHMFMETGKPWAIAVTWRSSRRWRHRTTVRIEPVGTGIQVTPLIAAKLRGLLEHPDA